MCQVAGIHFLKSVFLMARIKYADGLEPIRKKHYGFTFIHNHYGQSILPGQRNNRTRYQRQRQRMQNIQKAIRYWRTMSTGTQNNWATFAATNPQPTKRNATESLTGYQLFLKRNHYCFLNHGIETDFMENPSLSVLPTPAPDFVLTAGFNTIDFTENYIKNFGLLPSAGQWLNFMCIMYSENSGQFFGPVFDVLQVQDIYLDGFFLNIEMPVKIGGLVLSVYMSKPLNRGQYIKSSKIRYMGCFTTKSFTGLSDVPAVTPADSGKVWGIKPDGTWGLITAGGGGGLTCEDLPECPTIIEMLTDINNLLNAVFPPISSVWLASTTGNIFRSVDGITWASVTTSFSSGTETNFIFCYEWQCFLGTGSSIMFISADGLSFSYESAISGFVPKKIGYNGNGLAVIAGTSTSNSLYFSSNGKIWQGLGVSILGQYGLCVYFNNNIWIAGSYNNGQSNTMAYSYDGVTWVGLGKTVFTTECAAVIWGSNRFVAVGRGTVTAAYSYDGISWVRTSNVFGTKGWNLSYAFGYFVCVATNGVWKSVDGITWTLVHADAGSWGTTSNAVIAFDGTTLSFSSSTASKYTQDLINWYDISMSGRYAMGCSIDPNYVTY